jgi:hypothetical protein
MFPWKIVSEAWDSASENEKVEFLRGVTNLGNGLEKCAAREGGLSILAQKGFAEYPFELKLFVKLGFDPEDECFSFERIQEKLDRACA